MKQAEWQEGLKAWNKIKQQAMIDMEQADLYIEAIENKIKTLPKSKEGEIKNGK